MTVFKMDKPSPKSPFVLGMLVIGITILVAAAQAATVFVNGSATFASISKASSNCAPTADAVCTLSSNPCTCYTGDAALLQNLSSIEPGSY